MSQHAENSTGLAGKLKAAGQYALKQGEKKKLETITLPSAYRALGKHVFSSSTFKEEFPTEFAEVSRLAKQIKDIQDQAKLRPTSEGMAEKAKAAAVGAKEAAQTKGLQLQLSQACGRLGSAVYDKRGDSSGPKELVNPIADARMKVSQLDSEIQQLSKAANGSLLTPKRIVIAGLTVVAAIVAIGAFVLVSGHKGRGLAGPLTTPNTGDRTWGDHGKDTSDVDETTAQRSTTPQAETKGGSAYENGQQIGKGLVKQYKNLGRDGYREQISTLEKARNELIEADAPKEAVQRYNGIIDALRVGYRDW